MITSTAGAQKMVKFLLLILFGTSAIMAVARDGTCGDFGFKQAYKSIEVQGNTVCFLYTKASEQDEGQLSVDPHGISIYKMSKAEEPTLIYELPYAGTEGKINDAFLLDVDGSYGEGLFILHSVETPSSWDPVSDIYDVSVIKLQSETLVHDQKLSRFFDLGGDLVDSQGRPTYTYPYKDRKSVEEAIRSPVFHAVASSTSVEGTIKEKVFLYGGDSEPAMQDPSKKYLIEGDQVVVKDSMAGWCKVMYAGKPKPITMWTQCTAITFQADYQNVKVEL
jgi:hypothetical protein